MALGFLGPYNGIAPAGLAYMGSPEGFLWTPQRVPAPTFYFDACCDVRGPRDEAYRVVRLDFRVVNDLLVPSNNVGLLRGDH